MNKLIFIIIQLVNVILTVVIIKANIYKRVKLLKTFKNKVIGILNNKMNIFQNTDYLNKNLKIGIKTFFLISILLTMLTFVISKAVIGVTSASILISLPMLFSYGIINYIQSFMIKNKLLRQMPSYILNIKSQIELENNIAKAMLKAQVEKPLHALISRFKKNVISGMNVNDALEILKKQVSIPKISIFFDSCKICYIKGGNFKKLVEKYLSFIVLENEQKEKIKEDAYGAILTLIIMVIINILVLVIFVFGNLQYQELITNTITGKLILDFNLLSYYLIIYLIFKIYKGEE